MKYGLVLLLVVISFLRASGDEPGVRKDVAYLEAGRREKADVYTPAGNHAAALPAVLLIHGGGWIGGDKADARGVSIAKDLAGAGYVIFAINYKLTYRTGAPSHGIPMVTTPGWPQNLYDCKSALRYMRKDAAELGIDPDRIAVMGESAGGHLALLLGSTAQVAELNKGGLYTDQRTDVACVVDLYGPPDLAAPERAKQLENFAVAGDAQTAEIVRRASPVTYLDAKTAPVLILHGTTDNLVPIAASRQLADRLKQLGVPYQCVEVPKMGHGFNLEPKQLDRFNPRLLSMDLRPVVFDFLQKYLGKEKILQPARSKTSRDQGRYHLKLGNEVRLRMAEAVARANEG